MTPVKSVMDLWSSVLYVCWKINKNEERKKNANKVKLLSERTSGVPPVIFSFFAAISCAYLDLSDCLWNINSEVQPLFTVKRDNIQNANALTVGSELKLKIFASKCVSRDIGSQIFMTLFGIKQFMADSCLNNSPRWGCSSSHNTENHKIIIFGKKILLFNLRLLGSASYICRSFCGIFWNTPLQHWRILQY